MYDLPVTSEPHAVKVREGGFHQLAWLHVRGQPLICSLAMSRKVQGYAPEATHEAPGQGEECSAMEAIRVKHHKDGPAAPKVVVPKLHSCGLAGPARFLPTNANGLRQDDAGTNVPLHTV